MNINGINNGFNKKTWIPSSIPTVNDFNGMEDTMGRAYDNISKINTYLGDPKLNDTLLNYVYPVNCIFMSTSIATIDDMHDHFGGTWEVWGSNKFILSSTSTPTTGGHAGITLTTNNLPSHSHELSSHQHTIGNHSHGLNSHSHSAPIHSHTLTSHTHQVSSTEIDAGGTKTASVLQNHGTGTNKNTSSSGGGETGNSSSANTGAVAGSTQSTVSGDTGTSSGDTNTSGLGETYNFKPSYITCYMYRRTA